MAGVGLGFHHASVRAARQLHQKKHRLSQRCFLIEGTQTLAEALEAQADIERIFALADAMPQELADAARAAKIDIHEVDRRTLDSLAQTQSPQPVVAVARFLHRDADALARVAQPGQKAEVLVLPDLADPGNAGTLIRTALAFGASAVCFGPHAVEPYNDKVVRASMGALFRVPLIWFQDWSAFVRGAREAELQIVGTAANGTDVRSVTFPDRVALLVGQERRGLAEIPAEDVALVVSIPQVPGIESLNASVAGAVALYEVARAHGRFGPTHERTPGA